MTAFVIEKIKNKNIYEVQKELVFDPLQMKNTFINDGNYDENTVSFYKDINNRKVKFTDYVFNCIFNTLCESSIPRANSCSRFCTV